jgi:hypothetical protein
VSKRPSGIGAERVSPRVVGVITIILALSTWLSIGWFAAACALVAGVSAAGVMSIQARSEPAATDRFWVAPRIIMLVMLSAGLFAGIAIGSLYSGDSRESAAIQAAVVTVVGMGGIVVWVSRRR